MYSITIYPETNRIWTLDICFETYSDAKDYLIEDGYVEENRWFKRSSNGWYGDSKAIINKMKIYKPAPQKVKL
jgi:hypothetical protein